MPATSATKTIAPYFRDGRLTVVPRRRPARLAVLDFLATHFEPGRRYTEREVDDMLTRFHPDYCTLRRYMVEEELMERRDGIYWRAGGTFELEYERDELQADEAPEEPDKGSEGFETTLQGG